MTNFSVNPVESCATYGTEPASTKTTTSQKAPWAVNFAKVLKNGGSGDVDNSAVSVFAPHHISVNCAEEI